MTPPTPPPPAAGRPNVLFITADQFRGDFLSCAGHPAVRTPHLDALGAQGAFLPHSYAPVPVCVPSRYAYMTGRTPISFGMRGNAGMRIPADALTLPAAFAGAGYRTAAIGKMHFSPWTEPYGFETFVVSEEGRQWRADDGRARGDAYQQYLRDVGWGGYERGHGIGNNDVRTSTSPLPLEHYHTTWATRTTQSWIAEHVAGSPQRPFFAWCSYTKPDSPYDPPEPYDRLYDARTFPPPVGGLEDLQALSPHYREEVNRHFWDSLGPEQVQRARAFYAGNVTLIDHCVGPAAPDAGAGWASPATPWSASPPTTATSWATTASSSKPTSSAAPGTSPSSSTPRAGWSTSAPSPASRSPKTSTPPCSRWRGCPCPIRPPSTASTSPATCRVARRPCAAPSGAPRTRSTARARCAGPTPSTPAAPTRSCTTSTPTPASAGISPEALPPGALRRPGAVIEDLRARLGAWLSARGDSSSVTASGALIQDPSARGWSPTPAPRQGLGLRPY